MADGAGNGVGGEPDEDLAALSFEELVERLEALTALLADTGLGIERAADVYERAQRLHAAATARLDMVARRIDGMAPGER